MGQRPMLILCMGALCVLAGIACKDRINILQSREEAAGNRKTYQNSITEGRVCAIEETEKGRRLTIKGGCRKGDQGKSREIYGRFIVYLKDRGTSFGKEGRSEKEVALGNEIRVKGDFRYFQVARNRGNFDEYLYYTSRGFQGMMFGKKVTITDDGVWKLQEGLRKWKNSRKDRLLHCMGKKYGGAMAGILLGERKDIPGEMKEWFQVAGISHILVISGLHISFLGWLIYRAMRKLGGSFLMSGVSGMVFLGLYVLMTGITVSSLRAFLFFGFRMGAEISGRKWDGEISFLASAALILSSEPQALFDVGFLLSFGTILGLWKVAPLLYAGRERSIKGGLREKILSGTGACLIILPILCRSFFEYSPWSILWNLLVIPLALVLLLAGCGGSLLDLVGLGVGRDVCFFICKGILWFYEEGSRWICHLPWGRVFTGQPGLGRVAGYYLLVASGLFLLKRAIRHSKFKEEAFFLEGAREERREERGGIEKGRREAESEKREREVREERESGRRKVIKEI